MPSLSMKIPFGSDKHKKLVREIQDRHSFSREFMQKQYDRWADSEERHLSYINLSDADRERKREKKGGEFRFVTLDIPFSYAILLTMHTYWASVFLGRTPVHQFTGRHGEGQQQVQAVEAIIDYQAHVGKFLAPYYVWLLDAGKYGLGILGHYWDRETTTFSQIVEENETLFGVPIPNKTHKVRKTIEVDGYQGNRAFNVSPYDWFPDPRVPIWKFQEGEFCGRIVPVGWNEIKKREAKGEYFNIDALKKDIASQDAYNRNQGSSQAERPARPGDSHVRRRLGKGRDFVDLLEMHIELIPKEWGLGDVESPVKWVFTLANDRVLIGARPLGFAHGKFPFSVLPYEIEGYSHINRGLYEITEQLNDTISWLFNTHMYNVRKVLQNQLIVDPSRVNVKDITGAGAGRLIRLKPTAYGTDPKTVAQQLKVTDVTQNHIRDVELVMGMIQRVTGVTDNIMGLLDPGGRKTATEVRTSSSFGVNRLKTQSEWFSSVGFEEHAQMMLQNTQQYYDKEQQFKVARGLVQGNQYIDVSPDMIAGFYDFVPVDGTMPIDRFAQANLWKEILMGLGQMPEIAGRYDVAGIFEWMAQLSGLKNISQFKVNVRPDEEVDKSAERGDIVPVGGNADDAGVGPTGSAGGGAERTTVAGQVSGVGPTG